MGSHGLSVSIRRVRGCRSAGLAAHLVGCARLRVPVAPYGASACGVGGVCGVAPRAVQRRAAGTPRCLVAQQDPHPLRDQSAQLTEIRAARWDQAVWAFSSQQATLRRLNKAFARFFGRVKTAKPGVKAGYPRFKGNARFDSVEWPRDGDGARWLPEQRRVYLQGAARSRSGHTARCWGE